MSTVEDNRWYAAVHCIPCAECGHIAWDMEDVCDCCYEAIGMLEDDIELEKTGLIILALEGRL